MATPRQRRTRTPEEIAKSMAVAKTVMENQKKNDGLAAVKRGRGYIFGTAVLFLISGVVLYLQTDIIEIFYFFAPIILLYVILGIVYFRNPLTISWVALGIFLIIIISDAAFDPATIISGLLWKILIISALIASIKNAKKYKDELNKLGPQKDSDDILDEELLNKI